jgi:hypothetical protein
MNNNMNVIHEGCNNSNSNTNSFDEEECKVVKKEEIDNSIHNDHKRERVNDSYSATSCGGGGGGDGDGGGGGGSDEECSSPPSSPSTTRSITRNPLTMRMLNPFVGVFNSSGSSSSAGGSNPNIPPNSSMKEDYDNNGEDGIDTTTTTGIIIDTTGGSDSPNTKRRMLGIQQIMNLRKNIVELGQQLKDAVTDEEKVLFRRSMASHRHALAGRMSSLDIIDSQDSFFGLPTGDGCGDDGTNDTSSRTATMLDDSFIIPDMPNNGSSSKNNNNNNNRSNNNKRSVDNSTNNAYQRSPLDVINDDSACSDDDDSTADVNDSTADVNDSSLSESYH